MVHVSQVYPTVARSLGMGFCTSFSRIGGMIAPFIAQVVSVLPQTALSRVFMCLCDIRLCLLQVLMSRSVVLALSPFAVACVFCALGNFLLPIETKGRALLVRAASHKPVHLLYCLYFSVFQHFLFLSAKLLMVPTVAVYVCVKCKNIEDQLILN